MVGHVDAEPGRAARSRVVHLDGGLGLVADGDLDADGDGLVAVHIVVQVIEGLVVALGQRQDAVTGLDFRHVQKLIQGVGEDLSVVLGCQFLHPASAQHEGAHVGADVAFPVVGISDVEQDDVEDVLLDLTGLLETDGGEAQALLVYLGGVAEGRLARGFAAHVGPVAGVGDEGHEFPLVEDGGDEGHVGQMGRAAAVGVVDDEHVPLVQGLLRMTAQQGLAGEHEGAEMHGQAHVADADNATLGVHDYGGAVLPFLDVGGVGGLDETISDQDFVSNGSQTVADYLNGNGVKSGLSQSSFSGAFLGGQNGGLEPH